MAARLAGDATVTRCCLPLAHGRVEEVQQICLPGNWARGSQWLFLLLVVVVVVLVVLFMLLLLAL